VRRQVALYKALRGLVQRGDMYRLKSPFEGNEAAWMFVSPDRREAAVFHFRVMAEPNAPLSRLSLCGLDPALEYAVVRVLTSEGRDDDDGRPAEKPVGAFPGDLLMQAGLPAEGFSGDFSGVLYLLRAAD